MGGGARRHNRLCSLWVSRALHFADLPAHPLFVSDDRLSQSLGAPSVSFDRAFARAPAPHDPDGRNARRLANRRVRYPLPAAICRRGYAFEGLASAVFLSLSTVA